MQKGLGMWIMSKMVLVIFLFSLVLILTMFLKVYSEKVISDTAKSYTTLWSEVASGALSYRSSSDSVFLPDVIEVRGAERQYTTVIEKVEQKPARVVFMMAWGRYESVDDIIKKGGFAAASVLNMPDDIEDILLFQGEENELAFDRPYPEEFSLLVKPSQKVKRDTSLLFLRNESVYCIASLVEPFNVRDALVIFGKCCQEDWEDIDDCTGG